MIAPTPGTTTTTTPSFPTAPNNHGCPTSGPAPGVNVGSFIENLDYRKNIINTQDPGVDPNIKPMKKHEFIAGSDWAITPSLSFSARYARNRLDNTIEDMGVSDSLGFYIGNPGSELRQSVAENALRQRPHRTHVPPMPAPAQGHP